MTFTQLFFIALVYTGAGTIIYGLFSFFYWLKETISEKKLYDEEQIELIVQKAKLETLKELRKEQEKI